MSGRKKNRRHQNGQPPQELLRELNSLRELLGSDMEADIPLLDQVADASGDQKTHSNEPHSSPQRAPNYASSFAQKQPQRPLTEMDLPILFSPVDEEPLDDFDVFSSALSEADLELLRPLQNLPRPEPERQEARAHAAEPPKTNHHSQAEPQQQLQDNGRESAKQSAHQANALRDEVQPGLFEMEPESPDNATITEQAPPEVQVQPAVQATARPAAPNRSKVSTVPMTENPFLPPHIRARLTGGRIPRPEPIPARAVAAATPEQRIPDAAPASQRTLSDDERARLLEQLVAEQLPELERQLRLGIGMMLDELYPKKP